MSVNGILRKVVLIYISTSIMRILISLVSPTLLSLRRKIVSNLRETLLLYLILFLIANESKQFLYIFHPCDTHFHVELSETILLPFLCSVASNGTCGFSKFPSSVKEFLQMQSQMTLDQWNEQTSWKLHLTHYLFFFMCGHSYFDEHKETLSGFHFSKLAISPQVRWVEISSSLISRSTFEENQGKKPLFSPKVSNLW